MGEWDDMLERGKSEKTDEGKAESGCKDLLSEIQVCISDCESYKHSEKLAGNVVKEEFWNGHLVAFRIVEMLINKGYR